MRDKDRRHDGAFLQCSESYKVLVYCSEVSQMTGCYVQLRHYEADVEGHLHGANGVNSGGEMQER